MTAQLAMLVLFGLGYFLGNRAAKSRDIRLCPQCGHEMIWVASNTDNCPNCNLTRTW